MGYELNRAFEETDLSDVYGAVRVPTLVLYRETTPPTPEESRGVASLIAGAQAMRVSGEEYWGVFLSSDIADELERLVAGKSGPPVPYSVLATLLFTDIVGSSERAVALGDRSWRDLLARHHAAVRRELARFGGRERDTAGDGFFATFDGPARAIRCACAIRDAVRDIGIEVRAGLHTGEVERQGPSVTGLAVHVGARVAALAQASEVLVTNTVQMLVLGSGIAFADRGRHALKGVPDQWQLYAVEHT